MLHLTESCRQAGARADVVLFRSMLGSGKHVLAFWCNLISGLQRNQNTPKSLFTNLPWRTPIQFLRRHCALTSSFCDHNKQHQSPSQVPSTSQKATPYPSLWLTHKYFRPLIPWWNFTVLLKPDKRLSEADNLKETIYKYCQPAPPVLLILASPTTL